MTTPFPGEPNQVSFRGQAVQIWSGTGKGGMPVLLINQDQSNTVTVNYRSNVGIGDSNAVPIGPQSSFTMDGGRTIYAIAPSGTAPLLVIPGGGSFFQRLTSLTLPTGATSGARIVLNGTLGLIEVFDSTNHLIATLSPAGLTDGSGNIVVEGVAAYVVVGADRIALQLGLGNFGGTPAGAFFTHDETSPANSDPMFGATSANAAACSAVMFSGQATGASVGSGIQATDSVGSGIPNGEVQIVGGQTTVQGALFTGSDTTVQGQNLNLGDGANAKINLSPPMASPVNWPTAGKTLAQTQACLDAFVQSFKNRGIVVP